METNHSVPRRWATAFLFWLLRGLWRCYRLAGWLLLMLLAAVLLTDREKGEPQPAHD